MRLKLEIPTVKLKAFFKFTVANSNFIFDKNPTLKFEILALNLKPQL